MKCSPFKLPIRACVLLLFFFGAFILVQCTNEHSSEVYTFWEEATPEGVLISSDHPAVQRVFSALQNRDDQVAKAKEKGLSLESLNTSNIVFLKDNEKDYVYMALAELWNGYQMTLVGYVPEDDGQGVHLMLQQTTPLDYIDSDTAYHLEFLTLDLSVGLFGADAGDFSKSMGLAYKSEDEDDDDWGRGWEIPGYTGYGTYTGASRGVTFVFIPRYTGNSFGGSYYGSYEGSGGGGGTRVGGSSSPAGVKNELTGKPNCVYKRLKSTNGDLFKKTIGEFVEDPVYNLTLKVGNCSITNDACTNSRSVNDMTITIEDTDTNPLQLAQYILHEAIHAELHRYVSRFRSGVDPNNRVRLFQLYAYYKNKEKPGNIQHIYMTEKYIKPIANALRQLDGNKYPLDYYKAFAWDGLRVWDANGLLSMEEDSRYEGYRQIVIKNSKIPCN